jgi:hypothetical protein
MNRGDAEMARVAAASGGQLGEEVVLKIRHTLSYSQDPSFSEQQIAYLEDLLANNLLSIVVFSRNGRQCSECFGVVDRVLDHIRSLGGMIVK